MNLGQRELANIATITRIARQRGYSDTQIAGILGNVQIESGFNHQVKPGDNGKAVGLFQQHPSYGSVADRMDPVKATHAILDEAMRMGVTPKSTQDPVQFAALFDKKVERSSGAARQARMKAAANLLGVPQIKDILTGAANYQMPDGMFDSQGDSGGFYGGGMLNAPIRIADYVGTSIYDHITGLASKIPGIDPASIYFHGGRIYAKKAT